MIFMQLDVGFWNFSRSTVLTNSINSRKNNFVVPTQTGRKWYIGTVGISPILNFVNPIHKLLMYAWEPR